MNIFWIRTIFSFEHFSFWTLFKFERFSNLNYLQIWTFQFWTEIKINRKQKETKTKTEKRKPKKEKRKNRNRNRNRKRNKEKRWKWAGPNTRPGCAVPSRHRPGRCIGFPPSIRFRSRFVQLRRQSTSACAARPHPPASCLPIPSSKQRYVTSSPSQVASHPAPLLSRVDRKGAVASQERRGGSSCWSPLKKLYPPFDARTTRLLFHLPSRRPIPNPNLSGVAVPHNCPWGRRTGGPLTSRTSWA
jgi:hypothetical protein